MKPDQERVKTLLSQTVTLLCKNGLHFEKELRIQGLLGITIDYESVFIVHFDECLTDSSMEIVSPISAGTLPVEGICGKVQKTKSVAVSARKPSPSSLNIELDNTENICSQQDDETKKSSFLNESNSVPGLGEEGITIQEDSAGAIKTEQICDEEEADDIVLVESENEQDIQNLTGSLFPINSDQSAGTRLRRDRRHRSFPLAVAQSNKRRRTVFPSTTVEDSSVYSDGGGNYGVKMEPTMSEYLGGADQNVNYEHYPEHSWDNSKGVFNQTDHDAVNELASVPGCSSWDGFDLQSRGGQPSGNNTLARSGELYHESGSGSGGAMLPLNSLDNLQIRNALVEHIIRPHVFQAGCRVEAFRVIWRKSHPAALEDAWNHIHQWRQDCDEIMKAVSGTNCLFFFSAVTGLYNKSKARTAGAQCDIYPAVSYYVTFVPDCPLTFLDFTAPIKLRFADAEAKQILSHTDGFDSNLRYLSAPLFTALKDCSSSYVRDRMERSVAVAAVMQASVPSSGPVPIAKLVVTKPDLVSALSQAYTAIMGVAPYLGLQIVF